VHTIRFCCLRRNVKPCCHTHDQSWLCTVRERAWSHSRWRTTETVTLSRVALGGRIPAVYDQQYNYHNLRDDGRRPCWQHLAYCSINSRHIGSESQFLPTPPALDAPSGGFLSEYRHPVWYGITRMVCATVRITRLLFYDTNTWFPLSFNDKILGLPWLWKHSPNITSRMQQLSF